MAKTLQEAAQLIAESQSIVLSTHRMPDGDGLGAEIALYHYLNRLGKKTVILNPDNIPARYQFLDSSSTFHVFKESSVPKNIDLWIVVDTNDPKVLSPVWDALKKKAKNILFLDHHPNLHEEDQKAIPQTAKIHVLIDEKSSSIGELLFRLFHVGHDILNKKASVFSFTPEIALGLYVSIITDTNSFRYARTTALSHRIAAELIDYGLQPEEIYQNVYSSKTTDHLRLIGEVLSKVEEVNIQGTDKKIVWVEIPKWLREKYKAKSDDTQTVVNFLLLIKNAEILILFREEDDDRIKVSLKSKGNFRVNHIAKSFGGGGHEFAAGFSAKQDMKSLQKNLLLKIQEEIS